MICYDAAMDRIAVINPSVAPRAAKITGASRPALLADAVVSFVDNSKLHADAFIERLQLILRDRYGIKAGAKVRKYAPKDELSERDLALLAKSAAVVQCYGD